MRDRQSPSLEEMWTTRSFTVEHKKKEDSDPLDSTLEVSHERTNVQQFDYGDADCGVE
jgi:hypothetical protein